MKDDTTPSQFIEVMPSATDEEQWLVSGPKIDAEDIIGDLMFSDRKDAINEAKIRGQNVSVPVQIIVNAGFGHDAEEWIETEYYNPFAHG